MSFGADLRALIEKRKADVNEVVRTVAIALHDGMVERTPVGETGRLRSNWQCGVGAINADTSGGADSGARMRSALTNWQPGQTIYVTNSLPYARVVEYGLFGKPPGSANGPRTINGYSSQAVGGMVRLTVQDFSQQLAAAVRAVK